MRIYVLTLFPDMINNAISHSIIGRSIEQGIIEVITIDIREFSLNKHKKVDDYPYGGGEGMVMGVEPIYNAFLSIKANIKESDPVIYLSPKGRVFNQGIAKEYSKYENIVLLCGHYEGVDQRAIDLICNVEISIGDFVLTGGELPALVFIDSVARLIPNVLHNDESSVNETFENNLLEHSQYTRPYDFNGYKVPDILLSGHHEKIANYRKKESEYLTKKLRPDLWEKYINDK